jgi:hypothetical protein
LLPDITFGADAEMGFVPGRQGGRIASAKEDAADAGDGHAENPRRGCCCAYNDIQSETVQRIVFYSSGPRFFLSWIGPEK